MSTANITITGYVAKTPELRTANGKPVTLITIPHTPRRKKQNDEWEDAGPTIWTETTFWDNEATTITQTITKGTRATITGTPHEIHTYQKQDGTTGTALRIKNATIGIIPTPTHATPKPTTPQPANTWTTTDETPF